MAANPNHTADIHAILGRQFNDPNILTEALQAAGSSIRYAGTRAIPDGNKRLALIGDAVLKVALLDHWYPGGASRGRSIMRLCDSPVFNLVIGSGDLIVQQVANNTNLSTIGRQNGLAAYVNTNPSQGGVISEKTLATTVEALLGAVYLDSGNDLNAVKSVMRALGLGPV